jgi:hypothetical protein
VSGGVGVLVEQLWKLQSVDAKINVFWDNYKKVSSTMKNKERAHPGTHRHICRTFSNVALIFVGDGA